MTKSDFNELVGKRLAYCRKLLTDKDAEYTPDGDKLGNFKRTALMLGTDPLDSWRGMWIKHVDSIIQMIKQIRSIRNICSSKYYAGLHVVKDGRAVEVSWGVNDIIDKLINEKLADNITYSLLLEGILTEVRDERDKV